MSENIRLQHRKRVYLVSNFCFQGRALLRPSPEVNAIILGCLAHAAYRHQVRIFGFIFLPTSFFMLVEAEYLNLGDFMRDFQSPLTINLNILRKRPRGTLYTGTYRSEAILDAPAFWEELGKMYCKPCEEGWVEKPEDYQGVSSMTWHGDLSPRTFAYLNRNKLRAMRRRKKKAYDEAEAVDYFPLAIAEAPEFSGLDALKVAEPVQKIGRMLKEGAEKWRAYRAENGFELFGEKRMAAMHWSTIRGDIPRYWPALCRASREEKRSEYEAEVTDIYNAYDKAYERHLKGHPKPTFPRGTYRPGFPKCVGARKMPPPVGLTDRMLMGRMPLPEKVGRS